MGSLLTRLVNLRVVWKPGFAALLHARLTARGMTSTRATACIVGLLGLLALYSARLLRLSRIRRVIDPGQTSRRGIAAHRMVVGALLDHGAAHNGAPGSLPHRLVAAAAGEGGSHSEAAGYWLRWLLPVGLVAVVGAVLPSLLLKPPRVRHRWRYKHMCELIRAEGEPLPCMVVDLGCFDRNVARFASIAATAGKKIRLATKSRHPEFCGLMTFSVREAEALSALAADALGDRYGAVADRGALNYLVAYPTVQMSDIRVAFRLRTAGHDVVLMVDCVEHVTQLDAAWSAVAAASADAAEVDEVPSLPICIDADVSYRPGGGIHLGVHRSPCRSVVDVLRVSEAVLESVHLKLVGVMGYEAHVAGLPDRSPFSAIMSGPLAILKPVFMSQVRAKRAAIASALKERGVALDLFNGGGSGSARATAADPTVTEVTVGSGLLQSAIFDWFAANEAEPAFCFALQATRRPDPDTIVLQSGGFIASGEVSSDKCPQPFLPAGLAPYAPEGFGEVQTPMKALTAEARSIQIGDPVFFRPAKAGEIAERFNYYLLTEEGVIVRRARTYRGFGFAFY